MRRTILVLGLAVAAVAVIWAQQKQDRMPYLPFEVKVLLPHETSPAQYQQVSPTELEIAAEQGWELVSVVPFVYKNEERGNAANNRPGVTQTYPAYYFKRLKVR